MIRKRAPNSRRENRGIAKSSTRYRFLGLDRMKYVIVGFKVNEENSIYYKKCKDIRELQRALYIAFEKKDADFVSIRKVRG